jgi:hypothetical protein
VKEGSKQKGSLIVNVEVDDCNNLILKLSDGKNKKQLTVMVPENYPSGKKLRHF